MKSRSLLSSIHTNRKAKMKLFYLLLSLAIPSMIPAFVVQTKIQRHTNTLLKLSSSMKPPPVKNETVSSIDESPLSSDELNFEEPTFPQNIQATKVQSGRKELWFDESSGRFYEAGSTEKIPVAMLFDRTLDTIEDAAVHAGRIPYDKGWIDPPELERLSRKTVVVLGSGWAAHALMKVADTYKIRLIVISPTNHFVFTPMLASASVGTVEYRSMTEAVRASNPMMENYIEGKAIDVDVENKVLTVQLKDLLKDTTSTEPPIQQIHYDQLVVAVGCRVANSMVPGAKEYCYKLKTCEDARQLRLAVGESLEYASRPTVTPDNSLPEADLMNRRKDRQQRLTWVIVGGGPTGVELAGELSDFARDITRDRVGPYHKLKDDIQIILVHGGDKLVPAFEQELSAHALRSLEKQGVQVKLNTYVKEVGEGWIRLLSKESGEEYEIPIGLSVWAAGIAPVPFIEVLLSKLPPEARGSNGRVQVDKWLRCPTYSPTTFGSVLVLGDAAAFAQSDSDLLPQTAQVAGQQGAYVARLLDRGYDLTQTPPVIPPDTINDGLVNTWLRARGLEEAPGFSFLNLGLLAYLGGGQALSQVQLGDVPIFSYAGSISFVLWRSVYLVKQVATRNRILVLFDWFKCKIFGRDITRF